MTFPDDDWADPLTLADVRAAADHAVVLDGHDRAWQKDTGRWSQVNTAGTVDAVELMAHGPLWLIYDGDEDTDR